MNGPKYANLGFYANGYTYTKNHIKNQSRVLDEPRNENLGFYTR